jgi:hypothetical protein
MSDLNINNFSLDDIDDPFDESISYIQKGGAEANTALKKVTYDANKPLGRGRDLDRETYETDSGESEAEMSDSLDPEAESLESIDPEENSPESVNESEENSPESVNESEENSPDAEPDAEPDNSRKPNVTDEEESLPSEDIVLDDDDIIIDPETGVEINDEEIIPEEKVVANEKDQKEDLFNEIMKMVPEKYRTNRTFIKRAQTLVKNCMKLKVDVSKSEIDPENIFKLNLNLKPLNYKPNIQKLLSLDFDNSFVLPIVNDKKNLFEILNEEYADLLNGNLDEIESDSIIKTSNVQQINDAIKLRESYRKGKGRYNYSYREEMSRLHNMLIPYSIDRTKSNLNKTLNNDTRVFRNTFTEDKMVYNKLKLEKVQQSNHIVLKNDDINIVGFIRLPKNYYNINNLNKVPLSSLVYNSNSNIDFFKEISKYNTTEHIKLELEIGDSVLLNFNTEIGSIVSKGVVEEFDTTTNSINVRLIDASESESPDILKIQLEDPTVDIINTTYSDRKTHIENDNELKIFLFGENGDLNINDYRLTKYLENIVPSTNNVLEILRRKAKFEEFSLNTIHKTLKEYSLSFNDFVSSQLIEIIKILHKNMKQKIEESEKVTRTYSKYIKTPKEPKRNRVDLISDKSLKELEPLYGKYPFYNLSKDSDNERLNWIYTRIDNGEFYFKNIVKNIIEKFKFEPAELISKIREKRVKLDNDLYIIDGEIEGIKQRIIYSDNKCPEHRIVKEYLSYSDLEKDNERENVEIDEDKRVYGDMDPYVRQGMFCILNVDGKKKLFKRTKLDSGNGIWVLESTVDMNHLIDLNRDFCETQQKKIGELNSQLFLNADCSFNAIENRCVTKELDKKISEKYDLENRIKELDENIKSLEDDIEKEPIQKTIENLEFIITSNNQMQQRLYQNVEKDKANEKKNDVNPEYELLYKKIDLYLEKISTLENVERYNLLDILISKYGRDAIPTNDPPENPSNIYCKYGNKVLCCVCDKRLIELFKSDEDFDQGLKTLVDDLGVEEDGMYWCKNCGREIHIAEYETSEGFNKNGARDVTHEVVEGEDEVGGKKSSELFDSLKMFLDAEDGGITTDNKLDIMKIYKCIVDQMGIKLSESDELNILKTVSGICATNIKPKLEWITTFKGKAKSVDKAYNVYTSINTIMYTVSYLFLMIQSSIPEYKITKTHQKCVSSMDGFPLSETGEGGINYFKCIMESLMQTKDDWSALKKVKLEATLKTTISKLSNDDFIKYRYKQKKDYLSEKEDQVDRIPPLNIWNEFRPPLDSYDIKNKQVDAMSQAELKKTGGVDKRNIKNYLSLKLISEIDKKINKESVENFLFNPALLGNSCCLSTVKDSVNYINFFTDVSSIKEIYTKLSFIFSNKSLNTDNNSIYKTHNSEIYTFPTFKNNVFPSREDIESSEIKGLFETYIPNGEFKGLKRIYYDNRCIFTNQTRREIVNTDYSFEQYLELLKIIQNISLENLQHYREENNLTLKLSSEEENNSNKPKSMSVEDDLNEINTLKNIIIILSKNDNLARDEYLNVFFENIRKQKDVEQIKELWNDLSLQVQVIIDGISSRISDLTSTDVGKLVNENLKKLGELRDIFEDNKERHDYESAKNIGVKSKNNLIKKYLVSYLFSIPNKIKNDMGSSDINPRDKPDNWNISQNYVRRLDEIVKSTNMICDKYIIEKRSNNDDLVYSSLCSFIKKNNKEFKKLNAKEHEMACDGSIKVYSKCTNRNLSRLLQYIFVKIFNDMLEFDLVFTERISKTLKPKSKLKSDELGDNVESEEKEDYVNVNDELDMLNDPSKLIPDKSPALETQHRKLIANLLVDILGEIEKDRSFLDKHTKTKIAENIEQKLESEKENNLAVMKDLDKESRQSLTNMIKLGMTTWKNLSKKKDLDLHFGETIDEHGEQDQANGDNEFAPIEFEEDRNEALRNLAVQQLGENYTAEEYSSWNDTRLANEREDMERMHEADVMPDDDGDDYGVEATGDDAYF